MGLHLKERCPPDILSSNFSFTSFVKIVGAPFVGVVVSVVLPVTVPFKAKE
jgi:hypothetical protein